MKENLEKLIAALGGTQGVSIAMVYMLGVAEGNVEALAREKAALEETPFYHFLYYKNNRLGKLDLEFDDYEAHRELFKRDLIALAPQIWRTLSKFNEMVEEI